jgi:hypothetical protein
MVLGLCDLKTQANITVDCSLGLDQIFKQAKRYIIESSQSLEVLFEYAAKDTCTCCKSLDQLPKLPSWVPDWRCHGDMPSLGVTSVSSASGSRETITRVSPWGHTDVQGSFIRFHPNLQSPTPADGRSTRSILESLIDFVFKIMRCQELPRSADILDKILKVVYCTVVKLHRDYESNISEGDFAALLMYCCNISGFFSYRKFIESETRQVR